jgi:hypothetical protein
MALSFSILVGKSFLEVLVLEFDLMTCLGFEVYKTTAVKSGQRCCLCLEMEATFKPEVKDELDMQNFQKFEEIYHCSYPS